jgi:hypothetical protein
MTKELAKIARQNNHLYNGIKGEKINKMITGHKYGPQNFSPSKYKTYTAMRKRRSQDIK